MKYINNMRKMKGQRKSQKPDNRKQTIKGLAEGEEHNDTLNEHEGINRSAEGERDH